MATKLSEDLWAARIKLEKHREPGDPSTVFLGELANLLEEQDITCLMKLRIALNELQSDNTPVGPLLPSQYPLFELGKGKSKETE